MMDPEEHLIERIHNLDPADLEDLEEEHPGLAEWREDMDAGEDVEDMIEDYGVEPDAVEEYIVKGWCPDSEVGWDVEGAVEIDEEEGEP